jgi:hypothetical protein
MSPVHQRGACLACAELESRSPQLRVIYFARSPQSFVFSSCLQYLGPMDSWSRSLSNTLDRGSRVQWNEP